jgi:hypothetical protein
MVWSASSPQIHSRSILGGHRLDLALCPRDSFSQKNSLDLMCMWDDPTRDRMSRVGCIHPSPYHPIRHHDIHFISSILSRKTNGASISQYSILNFDFSILLRCNRKTVKTTNTTTYWRVILYFSLHTSTLFGGHLQVLYTLKLQAYKSPFHTFQQNVGPLYISIIYTYHMVKQWDIHVYMRH